MNYITDLIEADIKYICSVMPYKYTMEYFEEHSNGFSKLMPGFRVKSLKEDKVRQILFAKRNKTISECIDSYVKHIISEIQRDLDKAKKEGMNAEEMYINVLPYSPFKNNIPLYFKLVKEEKTEEYLRLMVSAVNKLLSIIDTNEEINKNQTSDIKKLKASVDDDKRELEKLHNLVTDLKLNEELMISTISQKDAEIKERSEYIVKLSSKVSSLKEQISQMTVNGEQTKTVLTKQNDALIKQVKELKKEINSYKESMAVAAEMKYTVSELETRVSDLKTTNESITEINKDYEKRIDELEKLLNEYNEQSKKARQRDSLMPYRPIDMEDFDEYFKYNLNSIRFDNNTEAYNQFVHFFEKIAFSGMPLLIKHAPGINLANCLANTIYGKKKSAVLTYTGDKGLEHIKEFLANTLDRVVCIAGFIGNCNEMELIPLLEQYRNKIIVLTYMYDRTLNYIPMEILSYVHYINVDEFKPLLRVKDITEDPSEIKEETYAFVSESSEENRYQRIFREISGQCGLSSDVISSISDSIDSEEYMNSTLLFSVLPYITKVMQMNPYNLSKRLQKYAGESGKCPNKEIMLGWFG